MDERRDIERQRLEQAYIDGSVEGSPIDHDGRRRSEPGAEGLRDILVGLRHAPINTKPPAYVAGWNDALDRVNSETVGRFAATPAADSRGLDVEILREAIELTAIPTLLVFAEDNAGVRHAIEVLRRAVEVALTDPDPAT